MAHPATEVVTSSETLWMSSTQDTWLKGDAPETEEEPSTTKQDRPYTPLPPDDPKSQVRFQSWYKYDQTGRRWTVVNHGRPERADQGIASTFHSKLSLVTWNIDAFGGLKHKRIEGIISHIKNLVPLPDIIFLQEVSAEALGFLLADVWIRENWFSSEIDERNWGNYPFATMIFLSRARFAAGEGSDDAARVTATLGAIWRVLYPSRFDRDALCCDIFLPGPQPASSTASTSSNSDQGASATGAEAGRARIRLINVHLDSLHYIPSLRPRQLSINTAMLRAAGSGLIAGDFNPTLPEDGTLVESNGLTDVWPSLHPNDPGATWGIDGKGRFPPARLDKVATLELRARGIEVMRPGMAVSGVPGHDYQIPWSDHSGLRFVFTLN